MWQLCQPPHSFPHVVDISCSSIYYILCAWIDHSSLEKLLVSVHLALQKARTGPTKYLGYSFRIGTATPAAQVGLEILKMLDDWELTAVLHAHIYPGSHLDGRSTIIYSCVAYIHSWTSGQSLVALAPINCSLFIVLVCQAQFMQINYIVCCIPSSLPSLHNYYTLFLVLPSPKFSLYTCIGSYTHLPNLSVHSITLNANNLNTLATLAFLWALLLCSGLICWYAKPD